MTRGRTSTGMALGLAVALGCGGGAQQTSTGAAGSGSDETGGGTAGAGGAASGATTVPHPVLQRFASCDDVTGNEAMIADTPFLSPRDMRELSGTYRVRGRQSFDGGTVRIAPGTTFVLDADSSLVFSWNCTLAPEDRTLVLAEGTRDAPIRVCGEGAGKGYWKQLSATCIKPESRMSWVHVEGAGGHDLPAVLLGRPFAFDHLEIVDSGSTGMRAQVLAEGVGPLLVEGADGMALSLGPEAISHVPTNGDYARNATPLAEVDGYGGHDVVFHDIGIPYLQKDKRVTLGPAGGQDSVTFEAGVEMRFPDRGFPIFGWRSDRTRLRIEGTAERPVVFQSWRGALGRPGDWRGLVLDGGTLTNSYIRHAVVRHAGAEGAPALHVPVDIPVENVRVELAAGVPFDRGRDGEPRGRGNVFAHNGSAYEEAIPGFAYENVDVRPPVDAVAADAEPQDAMVVNVPHTFVVTQGVPRDLDAVRSAEDALGLIGQSLAVVRVGGAEERVSYRLRLDLVQVGAADGDGFFATAVASATSPVRRIPALPGGGEVMYPGDTRGGGFFVASGGEGFFIGQRGGFFVTEGVGGGFFVGNSKGGGFFVPSVGGEEDDACGDTRAPCGEDALAGLRDAMLPSARLDPPSFPAPVSWPDVTGLPAGSDTAAPAAFPLVPVVTAWPSDSTWPSGTNWPSDSTWPSDSNLPPGIATLAVERTGAQPGDQVLIVGPVLEDAPPGSSAGLAFLRLRPPR